jgi:hypothetical protein
VCVLNFELPLYRRCAVLNRLYKKRDLCCYEHGRHVCIPLETVSKQDLALIERFGESPNHRLQCTRSSPLDAQYFKAEVFCSKLEIVLRPCLRLHTACTGVPRS